MERLFLSRYNKIRHPEERAFEVRLRESGEGLARLLSVALGYFHGIRHRAVALEDLLNLLPGDVLKAAIVEHALNELALRGGSLIPCVNDGQRRFALAQVACDGLAENFFGCGQVENIVHDLEGEAY